MTPVMGKLPPFTCCGLSRAEEGDCGRGNRKRRPGEESLLQEFSLDLEHSACAKSARQESPCATGMVSAKKINLSTGT